MNGLDPAHERVLVTGGAGFVGQHLVRALIARGSEVVVLDRSGVEGVGDNGVQVYRACVTDADAVREAARGCSVICHLAAIVSMPECHEDPMACQSANVDGTQNVLDAAQDGATVVLAGSCAVYGDSSAGPCFESAPVEPISEYGESKLAAEQMVIRRRGGAGVSLRLFNIIGAGQRSDTPYAAVVPIFASALMDDRAPTVHGDGQQTRDFVPVDIVVEAFLAGATLRESAVINVGTGRERRIVDLLNDLQALAGTDVTPDFTEARPGDIRRSLADVTVMTEKLGLPGEHVEQRYHAGLAQAWATLSTA